MFDWRAQRPKCFKNLELFQDTPDLVEDFDSPICLAYTMAKKLQWLQFLKIPINCSQLAQNDKASFFGLLGLVVLGTDDMA